MGESTQASDFVRLDKVLAEVRQERVYQVKTWGGVANDKDNLCTDWVAWIREYSEGMYRAAKYGFRQRLIKVAALAIAAVEAFDHNTEASRQPEATACDSCGRSTRWPNADCGGEHKPLP